MKDIKRAKKATNDEVDAFLKGNNPMEHVIKIECSYDEDHATVIWRDDEYKKHYDTKPFYPFCWAKQEAGRAMCKGSRNKLSIMMQEYGISCKGLVTANEEGFVPERMAEGYNVLFFATKPMSNKDFSRFFDKADVPLRPKEKHWSYGKDYYICVAPNEQFMIQTGIRLFKGYESYDDIKRLQFDIETSGLDPKTDTLDQIGIRTNKGFEKIITVTGDNPDEYYTNAHNAICEFYDIIAEEDPDVVSGYNSENFDWNFFDVFGQVHYDECLADMSKRPGLEKGIYKKTRPSILKLGGEIEYYYPTVMWGKHITDCLFSVRRAQALDSDMKKATLKYVTKYSKINKSNRVYVPGKLINATWADTEGKYAFNDTDGEWFKIDCSLLSERYFNTVIRKHVEKKKVKKTVEFDDESELKKHITVEGLYADEYGCLHEIDNFYDNTVVYIEETETEEDIEENVDCGAKYTMHVNTLKNNETGKEYDIVSGRYIVQRYLLDDLWETDKIELRYNESNFLVGKMLPVNFERMCTMGTATIWKYIMMAWSYEHDLAIPKTISSRSFTGGLSRLLTVGYIPNVQKLDFNSLYPSIILSMGIKTPIDISGAMPAMLEYILTQREYYKGLKGKYKKKAESTAKKIEELLISGADDDVINKLKSEQQQYEALQTRNDKMQLPLKITGNAYFGSFGSGGGIFPWSDIDCAEETTCCGRQMLRLMLKWFTDIGYQGIVCDTDGMNFRQPDKFRYTDENPYISTGMNRNTVKGEKYVGPWGDLAEFNDLFMRVKNGLDIDEFVPSSCYIARKNYMDLLDVKKQKVKLVGNTIKSKKMPIYIENFIDDTVRDLLNDRGKVYLDKYYDKIEEIYNLKIPLKDIASVGKVKMSISEYKEKCNEVTKAGNKRARQAWMELAIKHNLDVHMGDSIYYINTGSRKSDSDVKRETKYYRYVSDIYGSEKTDVTNKLRSEYDKLKKLAKDRLDKDAMTKLGMTNGNKVVSFSEYVRTYYSDVIEEDKLIFNCMLVPSNIIEDEDKHYCDDENIEYNVEKYIEVFNSRIKPQLVCFDKSIRVKYETNKKGKIVEENNILISNPKDRKYFTEKQCKLISGQPYKQVDQDTYEQLMTMEDKEIKFWLSVNKTPIYIRECGMDWEKIKEEYFTRMNKLNEDGIRNECEIFESVINSIADDDIEKLISEGEIPEKILEICDFDYASGGFISKKHNIKIGTLYDIIDCKNNANEDNIDDSIMNWLV